MQQKFMMMPCNKLTSKKLKGDYFWDVTTRHPSKESRPEIPKEKKRKGRDSRIEDDLRVQGHEIIAKVFLRLFGGRRLPGSRLMKNSTALSGGIPGSSSGKTSTKSQTTGRLEWLGEGRHLE